MIKLDYMPMIKDNKVKPVAITRPNMERGILAMGFAALFILVPSFRDVDRNIQLILAGMIITYCIASEMRYLSQVKSYQESMDQYKRWDFQELPKKCSLKLVTVMSGSPSMIAHTLVDPLIRPLWDAKLSSVKKIDEKTIELKYNGV